jgi:hypothetical protein
MKLHGPERLYPLECLVGPRNSYRKIYGGLQICSRYNLLHSKIGRLVLPHHDRWNTKFQIPKGLFPGIIDNKGFDRRIEIASDFNL